MSAIDYKGRGEIEDRVARLEARMRGVRWVYVTCYVCAMAALGSLVLCFYVLLVRDII